MDKEKLPFFPLSLHTFSTQYLAQKREYGEGLMLSLWERLSSRD
jgi:hypothetical protein